MVKTSPCCPRPSAYPVFVYLAVYPSIWGSVCPPLKLCADWLHLAEADPAAFSAPDHGHPGGAPLCGCGHQPGGEVRGQCWSLGVHRPEGPACLLMAPAQRGGCAWDSSSGPGMWVAEARALRGPGGLHPGPRPVSQRRAGVVWQERP